METAARTQAMFLDIWNATLSSYPLSAQDLTTNINATHLMGALLEVLTALGVDRDAILGAPPEEERDEHTEYYWDLIPILNITRAVNHLASVTPGYINFNMMYILTPTPQAAQAILLFLLNYMQFSRTCRENIEPYESELFQHRDQVTTLEEEKDRLLEKLNDQAVAKASRAIRLEKLEEDKKLFTDEMKRVSRSMEAEIGELEQVLQQNRELETAMEQRRAQKEALAAEMASIKAQKVNDADDIKLQYEQAVRSEKDAAEKVDALQHMLLNKETTIKNLNVVRSTFHEAIQYVMDITSLTNKLKEISSTAGREQSELEAAVAERERELAEAESQLVELERERRAVQEQREREAAAAKVELANVQSTLKYATSKHKKSAERAETVAAGVSEIKRRTEQYDEERRQQERTLDDTQAHFYTELKSFEELLLQESKKAAKIMETKLSQFDGH